MNILIIGGGNAAHIIACRLLMIGLNTSVFQSCSATLEKITIIQENSLSFATKAPTQYNINNSSLSEFDLILFTTPSSNSIKFINSLAAQINNSTAIVGFMYGQGWAPIYLDHMLHAKEKATPRLIFSLSSLPWVCRTLVPGKTVEIYGCNKVTFYGINQLRLLSDFHEKALPILKHIAPSSEFIHNGNLTLSSLNCTNQVLHPSRFTQLLKDYPHGFQSLLDVPLFYRNIPDWVFAEMEDLDAEVYKVKEKIALFASKKNNFTSMKTLELENITLGTQASTLAQKISTDSALKNIQSPTAIENNRIHLNKRHRIVFDDIGDGLKMASVFGERLGSNTPISKGYHSFLASHISSTLSEVKEKELVDYQLSLLRTGIA